MTGFWLACNGQLLRDWPVRINLTFETRSDHRGWVEIPEWLKGPYVCAVNAPITFDVKTTYSFENGET